MPGRHSLFWRLALLVAAFCLTMIVVTDQLGRHIDLQTSYLSEEARATLIGYAREAEAAVAGGPQALDRWLQDMRSREPGWLALVDARLQPLGNQQLDAEAQRQLTFVRQLHWPMSRRGETLPLVALPVGEQGAQLVMRVPERFRPWRNRTLLTALALYVLPTLLSLLFCGLLYHLLITPLARLRQQANALRGDDLQAALHPSIARRHDELGELGRSFEHLTRRLQDSVALQQQLLRDLSHELRTPLSRLQVACESALPANELCERVEREAATMRQLVDNTLELAWLDSERPRLPCEPVNVAALWEVLVEDACFESGWDRHRIGLRLPEGCRVLGHLNGLAQAMENVLRNAIRHSPADGEVWLEGRRCGEDWLLSIEDQGPGVAEQALPVIFRPFTRLSAARPGGDGFGLGLAIAQGMVRLQGGEIWAENRHPGLRVSIRLQAV